jgi:hypothetical protein
VPDVEFGKLRNGGNGLNIIKSKPMAGMRLDPVLRRESGGIGNPA